MEIKDVRIFRGRNIYCMRPVIKLTVELKEEQHAPTNKARGFNDKLLSMFPGLQAHRCGIGEEGGFVKRLSEGTYPCHVAEHAILELQNMLGYNVGFGITRQEGDAPCYHIVYRYINEQVAVACGKAIVNLFNALFEGKTPSLQPVLKELTQLASRTDLGPSTKALYDEAQKRGIPVTRLGNDSLIQFGYGKFVRRMEAALTDKPSCIAVNIAGDKHLTKELLRRHGIPVPTGEIAYSVGSALRYAGEIGYPVVIKPYDSNHGNGVTLNIQGREGVPEAFKLAVSFSSAAVVEKHITGQDYRVLVVGDKVSAVARRLPPKVTGDGMSTIRQLVDKENENPLRGEDHTKPLTQIELDDIAIAVLGETGLTPESIPESGTVVYLRKNANLSTGGTAASCPDSIHPENAKLAIRAAKALGIDIAGVDICSPDISIPLFENGGAVLEVNAGPGLRMHLMPSEGPPATVAKDIMDMLYPPGMPYTVPICAVTGTNGKTTVTRLIAHTIALSGIKVGMTTTSGVYLGEECLLPGDNTGAVSASIVLSHPDTEAAVLETARGGIVRRGLGYDLADVGVITNISEDHLGQDGIETMEDLAHVKSLVVEAVKPWGCAVLNADDKMTPYFLKRVRCNVLMFSRDQESVLLKEHLMQGGNAVWAHQGGLYTQYLGKTTILCRVEDIPITLKGTASCNVENALAAAAALLGLGIPESQIRQGLSSFRPDGENNPGRFNLFEIGHVKVMLDYGHNIAGYSHVIDFLKKQNAKRLVGVIGVPGDRQDESVKKVGALCGQHFHKLIIKEDDDLRGRKPGEIAAILQDAAMKSKNPQLELEVCLKEEDALGKAITQAQPGDFIAVFYEKFEPLKTVITSQHHGRAVKM